MARLKKIQTNPALPAYFDSTPHHERTNHDLIKWWGRPFIRTVSADQLFPEQRHAQFKAEFLSHYPDGVRYDVRCLDGGAWDRSTAIAACKTPAEAMAVALHYTPLYRTYEDYQRENPAWEGGQIA